jgi:hypothetical protein
VQGMGKQRDAPHLAAHPMSKPGDDVSTAMRHTAPT